jgi:LysM repeat protein
VGQQIRVPALVADVACVPRVDWPRYLVRSGDTLYSVASQVGTTVQQLQWANCLGNTLVIAGTYLRVPRLPSLPPAPPRPTMTITPQGTSTPRPN